LIPADECTLDRHLTKIVTIGSVTRQSAREPPKPGHDGQDQRFKTFGQFLAFPWMKRLLLPV